LSLPNGVILRERSTATVAKTQLHATPIETWSIWSQSQDHAGVGHASNHQAAEDP